MFSKAWPFLIFLMGALLFELTDWDFKINDLFFNFEEGVWLYGQSWWVNQFIHKIGSFFIKCIALSLVLIFMFSFFWKRVQFMRRGSLFAILVIALGPGLVALGKQVTNMDCPAQLERYSGDRPYVKLFDRKPQNIKRGKCFPGGHSSGAFALFFIYFLMRDSNKFKKYAKFVLIASIGLGSVYAFGQWARGSHFPSHDWYSLFICWFIASLLDLIFSNYWLFVDRIRLHRLKYHLLGR